MPGKYFNRFFIIFLSLIIFTTTLNAQPSSVIRGQVIDSDTGDPLQSANILVVDPETGEEISGTASNERGMFRIVNLPSGTYSIQVKMLGYENISLENISLNASSPRINLEQIYLMPTTLSLSDVTMTVKRDDTILAPDRKIYRVDNSIIDGGGTASEVLDNIPSVTVDIDGNVSLRGSENVRILIDGKPSSRMGLNSADALQKLPANQIDRIEVITNPSARYDAEGTAGIINIIQKRERKPGLNGSVNLSAGYPGRVGGGFDVNYRIGKVNLFLRDGFRIRKDEGEAKVDQEFFNDDSLSTLDEDREFERNGWSNRARTGLEYFFDDNNTLSGFVFHEYGERENSSETVYRYYNIDDELVSHIQRNSPEDEIDHWYGFELNYFRNFNGEGHQLTSDFKFETGSDDEQSSVEEFSLFDVDTYPDIEQEVSSVEEENSYLFKLDYQNPFSDEGRFEFGLKSHVRDLSHDYSTTEYVDQGVPEEIADLSNDMSYLEGIHAAYFTFANRMNGFSYQLGLRTEYSEISTEFRDSNDLYDRDYLDWFPSVHLNYDISTYNTLQLSYSKRLRRPRHWLLIPFWNYADSRNIRRGNPNLDPEYTQSYEIGNILHNGFGSISSSVYYRYSDNVIEFLQVAEDSVIVSQPYNLSTRDSYGAEFIVSGNLLRWWMVQGNINAFRAITSGEYDGTNFDTDTYSWFARLSSKFTFAKLYQAQVRFNYRGPRKTAQGERKPVYMMDLGFSRNLLDGKATMSLSVRDLFNSRKHESETTTDNFYSHSEYRRRSRTITLQLNYYFSKERKKRRDDIRFNDDFDEEMD